MDDVTSQCSSIQTSTSIMNQPLEPFTSSLYIFDQPYYCYNCNCCRSSFFTSLNDFDHLLLHQIDHPKSEKNTSQPPAINFSSTVIDMSSYLNEFQLPPIDCPDFDVGNGKFFYRSSLACDEDVECLTGISDFFSPCVLPTPTDFCNDVTTRLRKYHAGDSYSIFYDDVVNGTISNKKMKFNA